MKSGFGNSRGSTPTLNPRAKPLKRPSQARAIFTVEAIYEAFVRIWQRDGWSGLTTRAVALEAGVAIGTLYDYFPSKEALLSGYIRHCLDALLLRLDEHVVHAKELSWPVRIKRLIRLTCDPNDTFQPLFNDDVLAIEHRIAEPKHHRRVFQELSQKWREAFASCEDLPAQPPPSTIDAWVIMAWGGRRYCVTAQPAAEQTAAWLSEMEAMICSRLTRTP
ncbi:TetR/AcrR family transcriptional regulator [Pseudomonas mandelii]|uniref:TetR/AcrR family transcriptional regulator n=1 Tax=Pseudomonas mandelii TaxID=75612 RepID=A0A502IAI3_9PSED|nr:MULTISPECIES: TetR/AcrR family transcriptional regulator [Pseudomonas]TPG83901.1 TetR/AcrR family transcriptional regulator [Pseudomonas mandelii]TPG92773.1 TetR/AcrR family transcriptional regulator [Pseudomonas caspiana]